MRWSVRSGFFHEVAGFYGSGCLPANSFSILSSLFSIVSSLSKICLRILFVSWVGTRGIGMGAGHLLSSGLSGRLGNKGSCAIAFFSCSRTFFIPKIVLIVL